MKNRNLLLPLAGLCLASVVSAQNPPTPVTSSPPATTAPVAPAGPITALYIRARVDTMLQGITLTPMQRQQIDSLFTQNSVMLSTTVGDSASDAATRERLASMIGPIDAGVRRILTVGQQMTWDSNMEQWRKRQLRSNATN